MVVVPEQQQRRCERYIQWGGGQREHPQGSNTVAPFGGAHGRARSLIRQWAALLWRGVASPWWTARRGLVVFPSTVTLLSISQHQVPGQGHRAPAPSSERGARGNLYLHDSLLVQGTCCFHALTTDEPLKATGVMKTVAKSKLPLSFSKSIDAPPVAMPWDPIPGPHAFHSSHLLPARSSVDSSGHGP
jgi:hypothetical protein